MRQLQFRNNQTTYDLDESWIYDLSDFTRRLELSSRYSKNGSNAYGDRTTDAREARFYTKLGTETDQANIDALAAIERFFDVTRGPFWFEDIGNNRRASIEISKISSKAHSDGNRKRLEEISLTVSFLDGEYEDLTPTIESNTMTNGDQVIINNPGRVIYPVITITPNATITAIQLRNITNSSGFLFSAPLTVADTIIVNSRTGEITLNGVDAADYITEGGPISINPDSNIIEYNSDDGSCDVDIEWRAVYAF